MKKLTMKDRLRKAGVFITTGVFTINSSVTMALANSNTSPESVISKVTGEDKDGNVFQPLIDVVTNIGQDGYALAMVVCSIMALLCCLGAGICYMSNKNSTKKSENKEWAVGVLGALALCCMIGVIVSAVASAGASVK